MKQINRPRTHACVLFDDTFKVVIFSPRNRDFLIQLIELMLPGKKIRDIAFLSSENHGLVVSDKNINFDMFCTEKDTGEQFIVEMQFSGEDSYQDRMLSDSHSAYHTSCVSLCITTHFFVNERVDALYVIIIK